MLRNNLLDNCFSRVSNGSRFAVKVRIIALVKRLSVGIQKSGCLGIPAFNLRRKRTNLSTAEPIARMGKQDLQSGIMKETGLAGFPARRQPRAEVRRSSVDQIFDFPELSRHLAGNKCKGRLTVVLAFKSAESLWLGVDSGPEALHGNLETHHTASLLPGRGSYAKRNKNQL